MFEISLTTSLHRYIRIGSQFRLFFFSSELSNEAVQRINEREKKDLITLYLNRSKESSTLPTLISFKVSTSCKLVKLIHFVLVIHAFTVWLVHEAVTYASIHKLRQENMDTVMKCG